MKKLFLFAGVIHLFTYACDSDSDPKPETREKGKGSISLEIRIRTIEQDKSPGLPSMSDFTITLKGEGVNTTFTYPETGMIDDLLPGHYTLTATNCPEGMPLPEFENPCYYGTGEVTVSDGGTATAKIECTLHNSGLYFEYDLWLYETGLESIVPFVEQDGKTLKYIYSNTDKTGFFAPGKVVVTIEKDEVPYSFNGSEDKKMELDLKEGRIYKVFITPYRIEGEGSISLNVTVVDVTDRSRWLVLGDGAVNRKWKFDRAEGWNEFYSHESNKCIRVALMNKDVESPYGIYVAGAGQSALIYFKISPGSYDLFIPEGTYEVSGSDSSLPHFLVAGYYNPYNGSSSPTYMYEGDATGGDYYCITKGEVTVSRNGEDYILTGELEDDYNNVFPIRYEGEIPITNLY